MTTQTNGAFDRTPLIAGNWKMNMDHTQAVSYTHLTLPTIHVECRSRWSPYH